MVKVVEVFSYFSCFPDYVGMEAACVMLAERLHKLCSVVKSVRLDYACSHVLKITIHNWTHKTLHNPIDVPFGKQMQQYLSRE
jgi:hypothetical protein